MEYKLLGPGDEKLLEGAEEVVFDREVLPELARQFLSDPRHHIAVAIEGRAIVLSARWTVHPGSSCSSASSCPPRSSC